MRNSPGLTNLGGLDCHLTIFSTLFTSGVFAFRGNRTHVPGDKYIVHSIPTGKNSTSEGDGEDR
jgi:hypothetical protein